MSAIYKPLRDEHTTSAPLARDAGRDKLLYLDAGSGIAGDMLVAALIDLGVPESVLQEGLAGLALTGYVLSVENVRKSGLAAKHLRVQIDAQQPSRDHAAIVALIESASTLSIGAKRRALAAFALLARAEARVHAVPVERVHFHEVGAVDSIVDIVAAAIALDYLGARVVCSALPMGRGFTRSAHGVIPLPAPATLQCLTGIPTYDAGLAEELVTPTGACLVASSCSDFGAWPAMSLERVGLGAGTKELTDRPNLLRVVLGTAVALTSRVAFGARRSHGQHALLETNVDDMSGEIAGFVMSRALEVGALDAWAVPIIMKKGRPAITLCALCERDKLDAVARVLLGESTSLGLRVSWVDRIERARRTQNVETRYGSISVKIADGDDLPETLAPEYESCRLAATQHGVPIREVYAAALQALEAARAQR